MSKKRNSKRWVAPEARGLRWYALALPRYVVLSMALVVREEGLDLTTSSEKASPRPRVRPYGLAALADASHVRYLELFRGCSATAGTRRHYDCIGLLVGSSSPRPRTLVLRRESADPPRPDHALAPRVRWRAPSPSPRAVLACSTARRAATLRAYT